MKRLSVLLLALSMMLIGSTVLFAAGNQDPVDEPDDVMPPWPMMGFQGRMGGPMGGPMCGPMGGPMNGLMDLDLTDDQMNQFIDLHADFMKKQYPLKEKMRQLKIENRDLRRSNDMDEAKIRKLHKEMSDIQADLEINSMKYYKKAMKILTAEQREKLGDRPLPMFGFGKGGPGGPFGEGMGHGKMGRGCSPHPRGPRPFSR